ncbi:MAG TPA: D-alanyl-D-alanine carboxypeptidase family protein [Stellaceae bacterium]|nr:D-alanyl-D-alanine carboxypeptidase family protein [Stellaceae bacterium]
MTRVRAGGRFFHSVAVLTASCLALSLGALPAAQARSPRPRAAAAQLRDKPAPSAPAPVLPPPTGLAVDTLATHALIIEMETGTVLYHKAASQRMWPASMTKMMTAYVVFSLLKEGRAKLTDELPVSVTAWKTGGSKMFVPVNTRISIDDLLQGMIVDSGNDACVVLAEDLAGSQQAFVDMMNRKAKEIGLTDSHFADVNGLPNPDHWMTAHDLATLAERTITDFPEYYHYYAQKEFTFSNIKQGNRNPLLYTTPGTDGLKTGHTEQSGYSLTASVVRGDRHIIMVLSGLPTMKSRVQESQRLIEWAFREFNDYKLFSAGDKVDTAEVWLGAKAKVGLVVGKKLVVTMPRRSRKEMRVTISYDRPIPAPIKKGEVIGRLTVTAPNVPTVEVPLYAADDVAQIGTFGRIAALAGYMIWGEQH